MPISIEKINIIPNYIYFYHLDKFCILPLYPESITDSMNTSFNETNALSRSAPVFTFNNAGPRSVSISFSLHRDLMEDLNKNVSNLKSNVVNAKEEDYIDTLVKYLQAASLPKYQVYKNGSKSVQPPMVALRLGNETFIKGVINSAITVTRKKPIMSDGKYACVDIQFNISESDPYDAETVARVGSFRGICSANNMYRS